MKEYGKLSLDQFKRLVAVLPELQQQMADIPRLVRGCSQEKLNQLFEKDFFWADCYELPFVEQIALLLYVLGKAHLPVEAAQQPDPQQACIDFIDQDEEWQGPVEPFKLQDVVGLTLMLQRNILSIMLYQRSLSALLEEARAGNFDSLFKAVRVDRSIVACPTVAACIARAELADDKDFFLRLGHALKGPSKKHWKSYQNLHYAMYMLRECGFDRMSEAQLENLFVNELKLYEAHPGAGKNLFKQFREGKGFSTT
ncbi:hypothetical protein Q9Q94_15185 [Uliginosibacterium sp. 31-16]|uniref:hypothetical protein n=1 Tax=Uliginosibacterium sp. 31-16 TaxID=3068315 RepID=UPI00273D141D|nr:hypothetical protein [Uliginosibacterium sp. 31-16]MDP5240884.1 hypothetical protein [Uliginosibacterium sp. 31-16]